MFLVRSQRRSDANAAARRTSSESQLSERAHSQFSLPRAKFNGSAIRKDGRRVRSKPMGKAKRSAPAAPAPMGKARGVAICVALVAVLAVWFVRLPGRAAQLAAENADLRAQLAAAKARGGAPAVMEAQEDAPAVAAPSVAACDIPGFLMWLDVGGGQMHSALSIETSARGQRRVVAARGAVVADQPLVYVPRELTLRAPHGLTEPFAALRLGTGAASQIVRFCAAPHRAGHVGRGPRRANRASRVCVCVCVAGACFPRSSV